MGLRHWLAVLAIVLALVLLGFLLRKTQSEAADTGSLAAITSAAEADARADAALRLSLSRLSEPAESAAALAAASDEVDTARAVLEDGLSGEVKERAAASLTVLDDKLSGLKEVQQQYDEFTRGWQQLRELERELQSLAQAAGLQPVLLELERESSAYVQSSAPGNGPRLVKLIAQIKAAAKAPGREQLADLSAAAIAMLSARDKLEASAKRVSRLSSAASLRTLREGYDAYLAAAQREAARYRVILGVYTVALLFSFGLIGSRLRGTVGELDRANAELQDTNANLEKIVEQRTEDLRRAMADLRQQQAQLIQSEKMASLGQMVAGVAHEINTPLGYASSNVSTVRDQLGSIGGDEGVVADFKLLLDDAEHGLKQIAELVLSLKDFSRVDRSRNDLFDINEGLDTALRICGNQLKGRVEVEREYAQLPRIPCAPSQLNQVFLNIFNNAGQAIEGEGSIRVRTRDAGDSVEIGIRDSGRGMDAQTQAHIFEPFFTTKDVGKGTGLGLTIAFRIIEDHGGRIAVESAPGQGTEFIIALPKQAAPAKQVAQAA